MPLIDNADDFTAGGMYGRLYAYLDGARELLRLAGQTACPPLEAREHEAIEYAHACVNKSIGLVLDSSKRNKFERDQQKG